MKGMDIKGKVNIISSAEELFAKRVVFGLIVKSPITAWHFLIPGMFILQYLKRSREIREYTTHFLFPRMLGLELAQDIIRGEDRERRLLQIKESVKEWLTSLKLYSEKLLKRQMEAIRLYAENYSRLLNAEGKSYYSLVKDAYRNRGNYESYLHQIKLSEGEVDRAIIELLGEGIKERLLKESEQVERLRRKEVEEIFLEDQP